MMARGNASAVRKMPIHVLNSRRVAEELKRDAVTSREQVLYLLAGWVFYLALSYSTLIYSNISRTWIGAVEFVCVAIVSVVGFFYAYKTNGGEKGREFVVRFTCLLLPVSVQVYVLVWAFYYLFAWWFSQLLPNLSFASQASANQFIWFAQVILPPTVTLVFIALTQIIIFWKVANHIRWIARSE
jgi:hypothetical protein